MIDTLIVQNGNKFEIEKYDGQNLDEYEHVAELNHDELCTHKANGYYYMETITMVDIFNYLTNEFNYQF